MSHKPVKFISLVLVNLFSFEAMNLQFISYAALEFINRTLYEKLSDFSMVCSAIKKYILHPRGFNDGNFRCLVLPSSEYFGVFMSAHLPRD